MNLTEDMSIHWINNLCQYISTSYLSININKSFKETGGIEYTADVVWGLQLQIINSGKYTSSDKKYDLVNEAKKENPRKLELVCLKNRFGISYYSCSFLYYPDIDLFKPEY